METSETMEEEQLGASLHAVAIDADETASIAKLAAALAKAQGAMKAASKDKENPHFRSRYADLASIWDACREPLSANGLCVMQRVSTVPEGVMVTTVLAHASGEWVRDRATFPVAQRTPQAYGSAITYARRYALSALVGVAAGEDDDGNAASGPGGELPPPPRQAPRQQSARKAEDPRLAAHRARTKRIWDSAQKQGLSLDEFKGWVTSILGREVSSRDWTSEDMDALEEAMRAEAEMARDQVA